MQHSIFLAQALSIYLTVMGFSMLFNRDYFYEAAIETITQKGLSLLTALFTLVLGIVIVLFHNHWMWNWRVIITVLGWITLIKGVVRLIIPSQVEQSLSVYSQGKVFYLVSLVMIALGVVLAYYGFKW